MFNFDMALVKELVTFRFISFVTNRIQLFLNLCETIRLFITFFSGCLKYILLYIYKEEGYN